MTEEQQEILDTVRSTTSHVVIQAGAGCGKTTTLRLCHQDKPGLLLAFNKLAAKQGQGQTFHAMAYRAWALYLRKKIHLDSGKTRKIIKKQKLPVTPELVSKVSIAKAHLQAPTLSLPIPPRNAASCPVELSNLLKESYEQAWQGTIDFDDMVTCSALWSVPLPTPPTLYVDEAQDLTPAQHRLISKIDRRTIAVGDNHQAIYDFRGAVDMSGLELANPTRLTLTTCFRCSQAVVQEAGHGLRPAPDAPDGVVDTIDQLPQDIKPTDAFLCRNNAPLYSLAVTLANQGIWPRLENARELLSLLKTFPSVKSFLRAFPEASDESQSVRALGKNPLTILKKLSTTMKGPTLITVHKAKGLEWPRVYLWCPDLLTGNLLYVARTRAIEELYYVCRL